MAFINGVEVLFSAQVVKEGVVQTKGNSTTDVMSQRAVTTELNALDEKINKIDGGIVVDNYRELIDILYNASADEYKLGQAIYVRQDGLPDLWISDVDPDNYYMDYTYTTDEQFIADLRGAVTVYKLGFGYFYVSLLETEKTDLSSCATKSEVNALRDKVNAKFVITDKRLANLEAGIPDDDFITDNSTAYVRDVPSNALPYAEITEIGGVTRKCTNLVNIRDWLYPNYGTINSDGSLTLTTTSSINLVKEYTGAFPSGNYTVSNISGLMLYVQLAQNDYSISVDAGASWTFTYDGTSYLRFVYANQKANTTVTYKVMFNPGGTLLPYEPFFEGLRSAPTTSVVSKGVNLTTAQEVYKGAFGYAEMVVDGRNCIRMASGVTIRNSPFVFKENTQYTVSFYAKSENFNGATTGNHGFTFFYSDGTTSSISIWQDATSWQLYTLTSTSGKTVTHIGVESAEYRAYVYLDADTFMLNKGTTALPYRPYIKRTLPISEAVRPAHGIPGTDIYDRIRWRYDGATDKWVREYVKRVGCVDMGACSWEYDGKIFYANVYGMKRDSLVLTTPYTCVPYDTFYGQTDKVINAHWSYYQSAVNVKDSAYTDAATFKAAMSGVMLVYELEEPEVTDISHLLPEDNLIGVEGGGTITMANEYGYDVPAKITYQIEEETV